MNRFRNIHTKEFGFTLIELMIVIAIIGILASVALPLFTSYRERAFNASSISFLKTIRTAEDGYSASESTYMEAPAGEGIVAIDLMPGDIVPKGMGFSIGVYPINGTDIVSGLNTGDNFSIFTGHRMGTKVYGIDNQLGTSLLWRHKSSGTSNPSVEAQGESITIPLPTGWGVGL